MHLHPCMRAHVTVQKLLCHGNHCELILSLVRAPCRLSFAVSTTAVSTKSVARRCSLKKSVQIHASSWRGRRCAAVSHKDHSFIRVGAGLIQFVYGSHSRLAADLILHKILFPPFFSRARNINVILTRQTCGQCSSMSAGNKRRALASYICVRICHVFLISKCRGESDLATVCAQLQYL